MKVYNTNGVALGIGATGPSGPSGPSGPTGPTGPTGTFQSDSFDYLKLEPQGCMVPVTTPASVDQAEAGVDDGNYVYGIFPVSPRTAQLQWKVTMPEDWRSTGAIVAKFHWTTVTGTPGENVKWQIDGIQLADSDPMDTPLVEIGTSEDTILTAGDLHISPAMTATTTGVISGTAGTVVIFKVTRIAASATESSEDARLIGVSIKYIRTLA